MPSVRDGVGEGICEDVGFGVDLAAGVEEGEGIQVFGGGKEKHSWCCRGEDVKVYLICVRNCGKQWFG
jgi:hypothetical protein